MAAFDFDFDSIGNDDFDFGNIFADESKEKEEAPKAAPAKEKAPEAPAEEPPAEAKAAEPEKAVEPEVKAEPEPAPEAKAEPETAPEAKAEEPAKEEPKAEVVKDEPAEEPAAEPVADAAPAAEANADVAADAPEAVAADAAPEAEPEPEVEVSVTEKAPKTKKAKKTKKAAPKAKAEAPAEEEAKAEVAVPKAEPIDEDIISNHILVIGPVYEKFKNDVGTLLGEIRVQAGMMPAVIKTMIQKNNELDRKLFMEGEGYVEAYTTIADKDTGLITCVRAAAEANAKGNATEKKLAGTLAVMNYTDPLTGKKINLLQYANALKQAVSFVSNAKEHVKATSIALSTMSKVA